MTLQERMQKMNSAPFRIGALVRPNEPWDSEVHPAKQVIRVGTFVALDDKSDTVTTFRNLTGTDTAAELFGVALYDQGNLSQGATFESATMSIEKAREVNAARISGKLSVAALIKVIDSATPNLFVITANTSEAAEYKDLPVGSILAGITAEAAAAIAGLKVIELDQKYHRIRYIKGYPYYEYAKTNSAVA